MPGGVIRPLTATELDALFAPVIAARTIGLAVSGGADSLALMLLAQRWTGAAPGRPRLIVYSLDHGLRPEAATEVAFVLAEAAKLGLMARGLRWDGPKPKNGVPEAARAARYQLLGEALRHDGGEALLTGHHRDDQAETVLMRLAHGSGLEGLGGMATDTVNNGLRIVRPLLSLGRELLDKTVADAGLVPMLDPSNTDPAYERVRWRAALPGLAALGLDSDRLGQFAQRLREADVALAATADAVFEGIVRLDGFGAAEIDAEVFRATPKAIGLRVLAQVLAIVGGRQNTRTLGQIERLHGLLLAEGDFRIQTLLGCIVRYGREGIVVAREPGRAVLTELLLGPGETRLWDDRFEIANSGSEAVRIVVSDTIQRRQLKTLLDFEVTAPMEALKTAPLVLGAGGAVLAVGSHVLHPTIAVRLLLE